MSNQFVVGDITTIVVPAPATGTNWNYTVPAGIRLNVHAIAFYFACDANAANRQQVIYVMDPEGGNSFSAIAQAVVIANDNTDFCFADGNRDMAAAIGGFATVPMSTSLVLKPGDVLFSDCQNIQVGDQFMEIYILAERFILP